MKIDIPRKQNWSQKNKGDLLGTVWSSRNLDFKKEYGYVSPSYKLIVTTLSGDTNNPTDLAVGFAKDGGTWYTCAGTSVYETSTENGDFDENTDSSLPTTEGKGDTDIKAYNGNIYLASDDSLWKLGVSSWSTITTSLDGDKKIMEVYGERLYIASDDSVASMASNDVVSETGTYTLDFLNMEHLEGHTISGIRAVSNGIWISLLNKIGGRAKMIFWDGVTENTVEVLKEVESGMIMAMTIKDDIPYILDNRGVLSAYNGSFFKEVGRFDFDHKQLYNFDLSNRNDRWIHPNGMQTINGEILMAINTRMSDTSDTQIPRTPAGVYAYNSDIGIYLKNTFTSQRDSATVTDMGQLQVEEVGAIYSLADDEENDDGIDQSDFFVAFAYKSDNSTTKYAIAKQDKRGLDLNSASRATAGLLTTTKWAGDDVEENWEKFYAFIRPFKNSTDKIVLKCREREYDPVETDITWVDTTSFTSTDSDWSTIKTNFDADKDYEFEGLQGDGAGFVAHISAISEAGGTYTVTLDETITGATTNTAKARIDRWDKVAAFEDVDEIDSYVGFNPERSSTWIQYRLYMIGEEIQLQRILAKSSINKET